MRCGAPGTSGHVTAKSSIRRRVYLINPASTHGPFCVLPWEICWLSNRTAGGEIRAERPAEVSRGYSRPGAGKAREAPHGRKAGERIGRAATRVGRRLERCPERGGKDRSGRFVLGEGNASVRQRELPLEAPGDEAVTGTRGEDAPVEGADLVERVLEAEHLRRALHQVRRHQGTPGVDGMTVDDLGAYLKTHGPTIRAALLAGTYVAQPVRWMELPKSGGGTRNLGIPMCLAYCLSFQGAGE